MTRKLILLAIIFLFSAFANAFEAYPEYQGATLRQVTHLFATNTEDSEYPSDYLTFLESFSWQRDILTNTNSFAATVGSLSGKRFMMRNRFHLHKEVTPRAEIKFIYFDYSDIEQEDTQFNPELLFWDKSRKWGFAIEGEVSTRKAEDDFGVALVHKLSDQKKIRLFYRLPDFSRNQRNEDTDRFETNPQVYGLKYEGLSGDKAYQHWYFRHERPLVWDFPDTSKKYRHERYVFGNQSLVELNDDVKWGFRSHFETMISQELIAGEYARRSRAFFQAERFEGQWSFGSFINYRKYVLNVAQTEQTHLLPYGSYRFSLEPDHWKLDIETTLYAKNNPILSEEEAEFRANLIYVGNVNNNLDVIAKFTFDLDNLIDEGWEGGNLQLRSEF